MVAHMDKLPENGIVTRRDPSQSRSAPRIYDQAAVSPSEGSQDSNGRNKSRGRNFIIPGRVSPITQPDAINTQPLAESRTQHGPPSSEHDSPSEQDPPALPDNPPTSRNESGLSDPHSPMLCSLPQNDAVIESDRRQHPERLIENPIPVSTNQRRLRRSREERKYGFSFLDDLYGRKVPPEEIHERYKLRFNCERSDNALLKWHSSERVKRRRRIQVLKVSSSSLRTISRVDLTRGSKRQGAFPSGASHATASAQRQLPAPTRTSITQPVYQECLPTLSGLPYLPDEASTTDENPSGSNGEDATT